jgi:hypothetical protein
MKRRKLNLKAEVESSISYFSFKRLVPGGFNLGLIGSTCTALPGAAAGSMRAAAGTAAAAGTVAAGIAAVAGTARKVQQPFCC